jgi:hypothetical protein
VSPLPHLIYIIPSFCLRHVPVESCTLRHGDCEILWGQLWAVVLTQIGK